MTRSQRWALAAGGAALALTLSACGGTPASPGTSGGGDGGGATGTIKIGIKFDQPGLGLQEGNTFTGFDVEVAKYVAGELGYAENQIEFVESQSAQRETMIQAEQVKLIFATYSITDSRKEKVSFAAVLHRRPGSAGPHRQHVHHRSRDPRGQAALLGDRLDAGAEHQEGSPGRRVGRVRHILDVRLGAGVQRC